MGRHKTPGRGVLECGGVSRLWVCGQSPTFRAAPATALVADDAVLRAGVQVAPALLRGVVPRFLAVAVAVLAVLFAAFLVSKVVASVVAFVLRLSTADTVLCTSATCSRTAATARSVTPMEA